MRLLFTSDVIFNVIVSIYKRQNCFLSKFGVNSCVEVLPVLTRALTLIKLHFAAYYNRQRDFNLDQFKKNLRLNKSKCETKKFLIQGVVWLVEVSVYMK